MIVDIDKLEVGIIVTRNGGGFRHIADKNAMGMQLLLCT